MNGERLVRLSYLFNGDNYELMPVYGSIMLTAKVTDDDMRRYLGLREDAVEPSSEECFPQGGEEPSAGFREWLWNDRRIDALALAAYQDASDYSDMLIYDRKCDLK